MNSEVFNGAAQYTSQEVSEALHNYHSAKQASEEVIVEVIERLETTPVKRSWLGNLLLGDTTELVEVDKEMYRGNWGGSYGAYFADKGWITAGEGKIAEYFEGHAQYKLANTLHDIISGGDSRVCLLSSDQAKFVSVWASCNGDDSDD